MNNDYVRPFIRKNDRCPFCDPNPSGMIAVQLCVTDVSFSGDTMVVKTVHPGCGAERVFTRAYKKRIEE